MPLQSGITDISEGERLRLLSSYLELTLRSTSSQFRLDGNPSMPRRYLMVPTLGWVSRSFRRAVPEAPHGSQIGTELEMSLDRPIFLHHPRAHASCIERSEKRSASNLTLMKLLDKLRYAHKDLYRRRLLRRLPTASVCAEVGVWAGDFSQLIMRTSSPTELHLIDPWLYRPDHGQARYGKRLEGGQDYMDSLHDTVVATFDSTPSVHIHRETSVEAASTFEDGYFDWIYLDADHSYEATRADLDAWLPKVRPHGFIAGDDYTTDGGWWGDGVVRAVDEAVVTGRVDQFFLTGTQFLVRRRT